MYNFLNLFHIISYMFLSVNGIGHLHKETSVTSYIVVFLYMVYGFLSVFAVTYFNTCPFAIMDRDGIGIQFIKKCKKVYGKKFYKALIFYVGYLIAFLAFIYYTIFYL